MSETTKNEIWSDFNHFVNRYHGVLAPKQFRNVCHTLADFYETQSATIQKIIKEKSKVKNTI